MDAALLLLFLGALAGGPPAPRAEASPLKWLGLAEGLELLRRDYRPVLVYYSGREEREDGAAASPGGGGGGPAVERFTAELEASLRDPALRKTLRGFATVELSAATLPALYQEPRAAPGAGAREGDARPSPPGQAPPRSTAEKLGVVAGVPALLVLDFRERVVRRYQEKMPGLETLRRELGRLVKEIEEQAAAARRVEKVLERAEYSYALGETREAVLLVLPLDDPKARRGLDQVLAERLSDVLERYREDGSAAIARGEALEQDRRYLDAVEAYRRAAQRFPFPEIVKRASRRQNDAYRKAQGL